MNPFKAAVGVVIVLIAVFGLFASWYTVDEGHVGVIKRWGKAVVQVDPGLHFKFPVMDTVEHIEVRQRKNVEKLASATMDQLPITATVSINWTVNKASAMELFVKYGGLDQFENRVLDPKMRSAAKAGISKYRADQLIRDRQSAVATVMENMVEQLEGFPVTINSPQIENVVLPPQYAKAVMEKEEARQQAEREKHTLEQQRLQSLRAVNTAEAKAKSVRLAADARAYKITTEADAQAKAIFAESEAWSQAVQMVGGELNNNPRYLDYMRAREWDGKLPQMLMSGGGAADVLLSVGSPNVLAGK